MILSFTDRVVQSFTIGRLIIVSLVARILTLFLLPPTPSFLAPDEGNYARLALWVAQSKDVENYPEFGPGLYNTSRTLIIPAAAYVRLGVDELTAIRIVSIAFGLLSIYFFTRVIFLALRIGSLQDVKNAPSQRLILVVLILFAFLPSNLIWSTLGLRESASQATVLASVFFLLRLREVELSRRNVLVAVSNISLPILSLILSFGARKETAFVFVLCFCISTLVLSRSRNFFSLAGVILCGTILGLLYSTNPSTKMTKEFVWVQIEQANQADVWTKSPAQARCEKEGDVVSKNSIEFVCTSTITSNKKITFSEVAKQAPIKTLDDLEYKRDVNRVDARTALRPNSCTNYSQLTIQNVICNAKELPYRITAFLIRPLPIIDSGSLSNNLASTENVIWILLLIGFAYSLIISIQKRFRLDIVGTTTLFIVCFSSLAALYEGNLGTAFRHKSTILWGLLLVITIGINSNWRKSEEEYQEENPRYAS